MTLIALALLLQAVPAEVPALSADQLMSQYTARVREVAPEGARLRYTKIHTEYDDSDPAHPVRLEKREVRIRTVDGRTQETTVAINDGPVYNADTKNGDLTLDSAFIARFRYTLLRAEPEVCRGCYLMGYEPRADQPERRSMAEEIVSRTGGTLLVDVDSGTMLWLKGRLRKPFRKFIFGKVYDADVQMSQELEFGIPMTVAARIRVHYGKFFSDYQRLVELSFFDFELD